MKMNAMLLAGILLALVLVSFDEAHSQPTTIVLEIDEEKSFIQLKDPAEQPVDMKDFQNGVMRYQEGSKLFVRLELQRMMSPDNIPDSYYLQLRTNLLVEDRKDAYWRYEGAEKKDIDAHEGIVWNTRDEHRQPWVISIELTAYIPESRMKSTEPGYGELIGFGEKYVYVDLIVKDKNIGVIQWIHLGDDPNETLNFWTTNTKLQNDWSTVQDRTEVDEEQIKLVLCEEFEKAGVDTLCGDLTSMGETIKTVSEEGHPGWSKTLAEDFDAINSGIVNLQAKPCPECKQCTPLAGALIAGLIIGVVGGLPTGYLFSRGKYLRMIPPDGIKTQLQKIRGRLNDSTAIVREVYDEQPLDQLFQAKDDLEKISRDIGAIIGRLRL